VTSIEELADRMLKDAVTKQATDIHIIPRKHDTLVQFRVAHRLVTRYSFPIEECERLISHFKFSASMDIGEKRRPQNGSYSIVVDHQQIGLRLSTLPGNKKESLVIRLLPEHQSNPSYQVSLFPYMTNKLLALLKHAHGLIILTGPTGSGKTTTLYTLLEKSTNLFDRNVIALEDPIEKESDAVLQVQVNEKAGISYAAGLKAILRHDPDIIMVGEIRDSETAKTAVRAALTGHLVLSTMHTRDAKGAIYRLLEFGVDWIEIEQTLVAVTAQRLVELSCTLCTTECSSACFVCERSKKACVFEILAGQPLSHVINEARGEKRVYDYATLRKVISKGIALGFIKETEYDRWVLDNEIK
jgi:competence protein ComGA